MYLCCKHIFSLRCWSTSTKVFFSLCFQIPVFCQPMILPTVFLHTWRKVSLNVCLGEMKDVWKMLLRQYYYIFICRSKYCLLWNITLKLLNYFFYDRYCFSGFFLLYHFFGIRKVLGFLLIARDYLSVIYCGCMSRCIYYLTIKVQ